MPGPFGFEIVELQDFGRLATDSKQLATAGLEAVTIDPSSEIDACWISSGGAISTGAMVGKPSAEYHDALLASDKSYNQIPQGANILLSVEHPCIGPLPNSMTVLPFYRYKVSSFINSQGLAGSAKLVLRLWKMRPSLPLLATKRAPLRVGWNSGVLGEFRIIPTFGRRLLRLWARDVGGGNINLDYGFCGTVFQDGTGLEGLTSFGTATPLVVPAAPAFMGFVTQDIPNWLTIYDDGANAIDFMLCEAYD